ncbi:hypothetical protein [Streptacidiphilus sp. EB103A]|uniref:hypothetical protein n=1 Tax=Streptacidiphilus sp. EB103A TaxID=3156275 RepID=UPI0035116CD2
MLSPHLETLMAPHATSRLANQPAPRPLTPLTPLQPRPTWEELTAQSAEQPQPGPPQPPQVIALWHRPHQP